MRDFHKPGRSGVYAQNGMCATSHPLASQVALDVLKRGGNAMDAALAGAVLLGFCEPQMTGIGGDCFALISPSGSNDVVAFNGSGAAPKAANAQDLREAGHQQVPAYGPEAVTIPTAVDAFCQMSERWGKLGLDAVLQPSIHYAEDGIPVAPRVAADWIPGNQNLQGHGRKFYLNNGAPFRTGEVFRAPEQAEVLRRIARDGRKGFYEGDVAADMVATLTAMGGVHTMEDFAEARAFETQPIQSHYNGHELLEHPPNGQGATASLLLNILSHFDLGAMDPHGAARTHIEAEATKLAYDARDRFVADPSSMAKLDYMLAASTAEKLAGLIDPKKAMQNAHQISEAVHKDTVYITVVDRDRMAVSLIYSIFHTFGSGIASEKFGVLMHNRGAGFTLQDGHANEYGGGKRPLHTILPGMLAKDGAPIMPFGVMGGQYQATGHARLLTNMLDFGMDVQTAIDSPRAFATEGHLQLENTFSDAVKQQLSDMGHSIVAPPSAIGGAQAIFMHDSGVLEAGSDPRKDGCALGY